MGRRKAVEGKPSKRKNQLQGRYKRDDSKHPANRPVTGIYDKHDAKFREDVEHVEFSMTRVVDMPVLTALGIGDEIRTFMRNLGMDRLMTMRDGVYPQICKDVLATARLVYLDSENPVADQGTFSFFIEQRFFTMTLSELCGVFEFPDGRGSCIPDLPCYADFWDIIASGRFSSGTSRQSLIRSPILRFAAKIIGSHLYGKAGQARVTNDLLGLMFMGVRHLLDLGTTTPYPAPCDINLGAVLAETFASFKTSGSGRKYYEGGMMITPIVAYVCARDGIQVVRGPRLRIDPKKNQIASTIPAHKYFDGKHLVSSGFLVSRWRGDNITQNAPYVYHFYDRKPKSRFIILPQPDLTSLTCDDAVAFLPPRDRCCPPPSHFTGTVEESDSEAAPDDADYEAHMQFASARDSFASARPSFAAGASSSGATGVLPPDLFPTDFTPYLLAPQPPLSSRQDDWRAWSAASHQRNNNILLKMWRAMTHIAHLCTARDDVGPVASTRSRRGGSRRGGPSDADSGREQRTKRREDPTPFVREDSASPTSSSSH